MGFDGKVRGTVSASHVSRSCANQPMTASLPTYGPGSGHPSIARMITSGSYSSRTASMSPAFHAAKPARTTSTFSCDIATLRR